MRFEADERGSVALSFGLAVATFIGVVAIAVEYARLTSARTSLVVMADAAALAGVAYLPASQSDALAKAYDAFDSQRAKNTSSITRTVSIGADGTSIVVDASATVDMMFGTTLGATAMTVATRAVAQRQISHLDIQLLLDVSASMGLASTALEMQRMKDLSRPYITAFVNDRRNSGNPIVNTLRAEQTCAFACHTRDGWEPNGGTALDLARANDVELRWDVVTAAAAGMVSTVLSGQTGAQVQVGGYAVSDDVRQIFPLTSSPNGIASLITNTNLLGFDTGLNAALTQMPGLIGVSGNGLSAATSKKVLVIATDGVDGGRGAAHGPIDPARCTALKATGLTIAVIDVVYVKDTTSPMFNAAVSPFYDQIAPNLRTCASSPELYIAASDPASIAQAFQVMAQRVLLLQARLSR